MDTYFEANTLDDLLMKVFSRLLEPQQMVHASRGSFSEIFGAMLVLQNPRARLSRSEIRGKIFSALGELFWYLSKTNSLDFMEYYLPGNYIKESDDGHSVRSGYGERLFCHNGQNQIQNVIQLLKSKPSSRRAIIQLFDASDLASNYKSIPCTCTLQFVIRDRKLNMLVNMRSNDAYIGLLHDVFAFTMLQEIVARSVDVDVGIYKHCAGSLHLYDKDRVGAQQFVNEGWQTPIAMPPMPAGDPWESIGIACDIEANIRQMKHVDPADANLASYWVDICMLLVVFNRWKTTKHLESNLFQGCEDIRGRISNPFYNMFIDAKLESLTR